MLSIVLFSVVATFCNFQATFPAISPKVLFWNTHTKFHHKKSEKNDMTKLLVPKSVKKMGDDVVDHARYV